MVVPIDAEIHEAEDVGEEHRAERRERMQIRALVLGHSQLQNHDRDENRDHAVAERLEPAFAHCVPPARRGFAGTALSAVPGGATTA